MDNVKQVKILYTNWKGETKDRVIVPISVEFKSTEWHKEEQWILNALDVEKNEMRAFAMKDIHSWEPNSIMKFTR